MDSVIQFIEGQSENRKPIMYLIHELMLEVPGMTTKIAYRIPFYYRNKWVAYLNPIKPDGVELVFTQGFRMPNENGLLNDRGRKIVSGVSYQTVEEIQLEPLLEILDEAIRVDDQFSK